MNWKFSFSKIGCHTNLLFFHSMELYNWVYTFPKGINRCEMQSLVQDLNSGSRVYSLRR